MNKNFYIHILKDIVENRDNSESYNIKTFLDKYNLNSKDLNSLGLDVDGDTFILSNNKLFRYPISITNKLIGIDMLNNFSNIKISDSYKDSNYIKNGSKMISVRLFLKDEYEDKYFMENVYDINKKYLFTTILTNPYSKCEVIKLIVSHHTNLEEFVNKFFSVTDFTNIVVVKNIPKKYYEMIDFNHPMFYNGKSKLLFCITDRIFTIKQLYNLINHFDIDCYNSFVEDSRRLIDCEKNNCVKIIDYPSFMKLNDKKKKNCIVVTFISIPINSDVFKNTTNCYIVNDLEDIDEELVNNMYNKMI
jgi:hypothetical protein